MNLYQEFEQRKIDYSKVKIVPPVGQSGFMNEVAISVIIPVHGRAQFHNIISEAFRKAGEFSRIPYSVTFVEHNKESEHGSLLHYRDHLLFISQGEEKFNKCLCFNVGLICGPRAKYYLFHDSDILVPENFFELLMQNMRGHDAVQAFSGQRLFHCDHYLTESILNGSFPVDQLKTDTKGVIPARPGAEGGSIFCTKEMVENVGGFPEWSYTEYSVEDSHFFRSLQLVGKVGFCNEPPIDCYHLWHEASYNRQTKKEDWERYYAFMAMNEDGRRHLLKLQSEHFKRYFYGLTENPDLRFTIRP